MRHTVWLVLGMACTTSGSDVNLKDDVAETDSDVAADTELVGDTETPVDEETDLHSDVDTDPSETDDTDTGPPSYTLTGTALCVDGVDDLGQVIHGEPAVPRTVRVLPGPGMYCRPLGGGCDLTVDFSQPLAQTAAGVDGSFSLTFTAASLDGLYLFSETTDPTRVGNCGSGYQFTETTLTALENEQGFEGITLDVYSIFF